MALPNLLLIGAARSGTTALYEYLSDHPDVFMSSVKEPRYFAFDTRPQFESPFRPFEDSLVTDRDEYESLFRDSTQSIRGEASTLYLASPAAPPRIKAEIPDARLIATLRHPIDRAFSHFQYFRQDGIEPLADFASAVEDEPRRVAANWGPYWGYRTMGMYAQQLRRFFDVFPHSQIKVMIFEEWRADPDAAMEEVFDFLGIRRWQGGLTRRAYNASGTPRSSSLHRFLKGRNPVIRLLKPLLPAEARRALKSRVNRVNLPRVELDSELRREMFALYHDEIERLEELLGRDLAVWRA